MNILVVGNGFDLAHGLPTAYCNCLDFLHAWKDVPIIKNVKKAGNGTMYEEYKEKFDSILSRLHPAFQTFVGDYFERDYINEHELMATFEKCINQNFWVEHFLGRQEVYRNYKKNWVDLEQEIAIVIHHVQGMIDLAYEHQIDVGLLPRQPFLDNHANPDGHFKSLYDLFRKEIFGRYGKNNSPLGEEIIQHLVDRLYNDLQRFTTAVEIYLVLCQKHIIEVRQKNLFDITNIGPIDKTLSFNYTDTFMRYMKNADKACTDACFIHGKLREVADIKDFNSPLVLGVDEYLDNAEKDIKVDLAQFRKYFQRIFKHTDYQYSSWQEGYGIEQINKIYSNQHVKGFPVNLHIFGHSLDITDKDVLRQIIMSPGTRTTIYHRSNTQFSNQLKNLIRVISGEELNKRTRGEQPSIYFKEQTDDS